MAYLFQMFTTLTVVALIVYLFKEERSPSDSLPNNSSSAQGNTYLEKTINRLFIQNHYYYQTINTSATQEVTFRQVVEWFVERKHLKNSQDNVAFTLKQGKEGNEYVIWQGFFNIRTEQLLDGRKLLCTTIDPELEEIHHGKNLAIYE